MSWLSKALGLDKKPALLKTINEASKDLLLDAAVRATSKTLPELTRANDAIGVVHQVLQRLATLPSCPDPKEYMAKLVADLREAAGIK